MGLVRARNLGEHRIEQAILNRCRIDKEQLTDIGIDAVLECEVHQHRAAESVADQPFRRPRELSVLVAEQEDDLFGESHHPAPRAKVSVKM